MKVLLISFFLFCSSVYSQVIYNYESEGCNIHIMVVHNEIEIEVATLSGWNNYYLGDPKILPLSTDEEVLQKFVNPREKIKYNGEDLYVVNKKWSPFESPYLKMKTDPSMAKVRSVEIGEYVLGFKTSIKECVTK